MDFSEVSQAHGAPGAGRPAVPLEGQRLAGLDTPALLVQEAQRVHGHRVVAQPGGGLVEGDGLGQVDRQLPLAGAVQLGQTEGGVGVAVINRLAKPVGQRFRATGIGWLGQG